MGCGTLDWADIFEHAIGILGEAEDARVREHLASCDACRADSGVLAVLGERLKRLGEATASKGTDAFAERTRSDARAAMGAETRSTKTSAVWRVAGLTESQRLRRARIRRREGMLKALIALAGVLVALVCALALAYVLGAIDSAVDRWGGSVERLLGIDLSAWGLRPSFAATAASVRSVGSQEDLSALERALGRLLRRELWSQDCRVEAVALLWFASTLVREKKAEWRELAASAVEAASQAERREPPPPEERDCLRRAVRFIAAGDVASALNALDVLLTEKTPLALYFAAQAAFADKKRASQAGKLLEASAERIPVVYVELAWRERASDWRKTLSRAPAGPFRDAAEKLLQNTTQ